MTVRGLLTMNALYLAMTALVALLAPAFLVETNGLQVTQSTVNLQRAVGAFAFGLAVMSWLMRPASASAARRAFFIGAGMGYLVLAAVMVVNILALSGLTGASIGWVYVGVNVLLAAAFLNYGIREQGAS